MRVLALIALVGIMLTGTAFAATDYTLVFYPGDAGAAVDNWFALPGVPFESDPMTVFENDVMRIYFKLQSLEPTTNNVLTWEPGTMEDFGGLLLGTGYNVMVDDGTGYSITYSGVDNGVPGDPDGAGPLGVQKTDMWISLPGNPDSGEHWIGFPFDDAVEIANCEITNGEETVSLMEAIYIKGWLEDLWPTKDNVTNNVYTAGVFGADTDVLEPGHLYVVRTSEPNLALIIPANN